MLEGRTRRSRNEGTRVDDSKVASETAASIGEKARFSYAAYAAFLLLVMSPFLSFARVNFFDAGFDRATFFIFSLGCVLLLGLPVAFLMRCGKGKGARIGLALGLMWFGFFLFKSSVPVDLIGRPWLSPTFAFLALLVAFGLCCYFVTAFEPARTAVFIFALVLAGMPAAEIAARILSASPHRAAFTPLALDEVAAAPELRNVYFVIADAYGSEDSLRRGAEFDNSDFLSSMIEQGYYVANNAYSPYNLTYLTISAVLNGDYIAEDDKPSNYQLFYPVTLKHVQPPQVVRQFRDLGYQFYIVGNSWADCEGPHVSCVENDDYFIPYSIRAFFEATPLNTAFALDRATVPAKQDWNDAIGRVLSLIEDGRMPPNPYFMFVHHLAPHPPYKFMPDCTLRAGYIDSMLMDSWDADKKPLYVDNLKCTSRRILELARLLEQHDPKAIVIVVGDHGPAFTVKWEQALEKWTASEIAERSGVLSLARFPARCQEHLSSTINSVNLVRLAFACVSGKRPLLLRNKSFITGYKPPESDRLRLVADRP